MILPKKIFKGDARHDALRLACCFVGVASVVAAQSDSMDLFDGDPSKYSFIWITPDTVDWTRHFHIGAVAGMNISANFSMSGKFAISGNNAGAGVYDDGYVLVDRTGNADGYTSYWGYNNASQYDPAGVSAHGPGTLSMHNSTSFSATGNSTENGGPFPGFDMVYGDNLWYWKHARVGWELGFSLLPVNIKDSSPMSASVTQNTYVFGTDGIIVPQAPFSGGPSGQGPIIYGTPDSTSSTLANGSVNGDRTLDVMIYTIRFGPSFYWDLNEYFGFSLGAGPAVGIVSGNYSYNENIIAGGLSSHNTGSFSSTDLVFGGYVNGTFMYHILNDADLYLSAQYMPMGSVSFSDAGRESKLNLGGQVYISAGISWPF
ncbi:MAG: hypothetical protein WDM80_04005 [Limisphaerales bacterium]